MGVGETLARRTSNLAKGMTTCDRGGAGEDGAVQQDEGAGRVARGIEQAITTRRATHWAEGVQKWRKTAIYPPKPTVARSVSACFAVRQIGAGEHDGLVIAVAVRSSLRPAHS